MPRANGPSVGINTLEAQSLLGPSRATKDGRSMSATSITSRGLSYAPSGPPPGSFASDIKSTISRFDGSRLDLSSNGGLDDSGETPTKEQKLASYRDKIDKETKIKVGSENLLEALNAKNPKQTKEQRKYVEAELNASNRKIAQLKLDLENEIKRAQEPASSPGSRLSQLFRSAPIRSPSRAGLPENGNPAISDFESESPTYVLAEILQALEAENQQADYYVNHANELVALLKRQSTLKYDLAWSIFGLRMQILLLSESREVVAAGYRVMRHAVTDRKSLQTIRSHHTDYLVLLSLVKESKASVEREQALKFVRAFLDVKDGVHEIAPSIARIIVAVAEHNDDRLRPLCIMTLAEILVRSPELVISAGGIGVLTEAMGSGTYYAPETLATCFLHLLDLPARRKLLRSGYELSVPFASFTEPMSSHGDEEKLQASSRVVASLFKSWSGLMTLSLHDFLPVRSVVSSLYVDNAAVRTAVLELLFDVLRIRPPSWSSSFLAGRRLTTYGRVTNLRTEVPTTPTTNTSPNGRSNKVSLVDHFSAVILAILLKCGLLTALLHAEKESPDFSLKRKTTLLIGEVLKLANQLLPSAWSAQLQTLPELFHSATAFGLDDRFTAVATIYQVDSVNRTLYRSAPNAANKARNIDDSTLSHPAEQPKVTMNANMDEVQFRAILVETQVLSTVNYTKWRWDLIPPIIAGPLTNPKRLDEAMKATKFVHRQLAFLRPFKYRFSEIKNTKPNQKYVRVGCSLVRTLLQTQEGAKYLAENKLLRQLAECLAQFDRMSGITSSNPVFSPERLADTLVGGYFAILGVLCSDSKGLQMMERWRIINMFYHIVELKGRDDLIRALLTNLDYILDSHPRIILAKAMISGSKQVRIAATRILRKYAIMPMSKDSSKADKDSECAAWAIRLLVTQLYDPEIEVCEVAIKLLEEACDNDESLEYVVKCRPALDHLGEIGAPLLLRFLSTSVGYHYLDGLDYITKEMDDWFLGRNDTYVALVESSLARALGDVPDRLASTLDENQIPQEYGIVPPHFYKELTRTAEGCELLKAKGHFEEFAATIIDYGMEQEDTELILKVKGCLWAVGNVGSMELGSPFLDQSNVIKKIVDIAEQSEVMTLRGTAFFVLGLISRSLHGQEILAENGWDGTVNMVGECMGYCLPLDFAKLFSIQSWAAVSDLDPLLLANRKGPITDDDPINNEILKAVTKLGNTVLSNKAAAELNGFKVRKVPGLQSTLLFRKVMAALASHHYRLPAWRFVIDLFDKSVMRRIVLEESDTESGDSDGDDDKT